ncbi:splicing factor 3B subunit 4-like [Schistocerca gregaria]|uniref:splicing factor 3B subunit 4-like n=1 Tax=Schistocerca gregaria TaxID=7010 RepID=UPI00211DD730|nr:splicing factor 3B subunit 4-like [Schistocerca gregaria]
MAHLEERNHDHTIHVSGLDPNVNEALLWELMVQAGPVVSVYIPRDKLTKEHSGYGFVEFQSEVDVQYAIKIMEEVPLYNKKLYINLSGRDKKTFGIGANLYIGHLDPSVDDKQLTDTFQAFGPLIGPSKIVRDEVTGQSKGYAFVYYDSFEASDAAIAAMNNQFFGNKRIVVTYAFKKDKPGERHGDAAERLLASKNPVLKHRKELQKISQSFASKNLATVAHAQGNVYSPATMNVAEGENSMANAAAGGGSVNGNMPMMNVQAFQPPYGANGLVPAQVVSPQQQTYVPMQGYPGMNSYATAKYGVQNPAVMMQYSSAYPAAVNPQYPAYSGQAQYPPPSY